MFKWLRKFFTFPEDAVNTYIPEERVAFRQYTYDQSDSAEENKYRLPIGGYSTHEDRFICNLGGTVYIGDRHELRNSLSVSGDLANIDVSKLTRITSNQVLIAHVHSYSDYSSVVVCKNGDVLHHSFYRPTRVGFEGTNDDRVNTKVGWVKDGLLLDATANEFDTGVYLLRGGTHWCGVVMVIPEGHSATRLHGAITDPDEIATARIETNMPRTCEVITRNYHALLSFKSNACCIVKRTGNRDKMSWTSHDVAALHNRGELLPDNYKVLLLEELRAGFNDMVDAGTRSGNKSDYAFVISPTMDNCTIYGVQHRTESHVSHDSSHSSDHGSSHCSPDTSSSYDGSSGGCD